MNRGQRGRMYAKAEIIVAVVATLVVAFLFVAAPQTFGPQPPWWMSTGPLVVSTVGVVIGLVWMVRIYRAKPEPDHGAWRYRSKRSRRSTPGQEPSQPTPSGQSRDGS